MRILLVSPMPPAANAPGAIPRVLHAQLEGLLARHDVTTVAIAGPEPWELAALAELEQRGVAVHGVRRYEPAGRARWARRWRLASRWASSGWPWRTVWFWDPGMQRLLDRLLTSERFDLVAVEDNAMAVYRLKGTMPAVLTEHEVRRPRPLTRPPGDPAGWPGWAREEVDWRRWRTYLPRVWRPFDALHVFSARDAALIAEMTPALAERVRVTPFAVDLPPPGRATADEPGLVVFVGNYSHAPNVDAACWLAEEIMPLARRSRPEARLLLIGQHAPARVQALASDRVELAGFLPVVDDALRRASVVVAPVRIGGGMRMKVLHAMALGKAVVSTARGIDGLGVPGGDVPVVIADTAPDFAAATAGLLADRARREHLGAAARAFVEAQHSPDAYARRLEQAYASLIGRRAVRAGEGAADARGRAVAPGTDS